MQGKAVIAVGHDEAPGSVVTIDLDFLPDVPRARALDARMHRELGQSLQHVCEASTGVIAFDDARMSRLVDHLLRAERVSPAVFGRYYELVRALSDDRYRDAEPLFARLADDTPVGHGLDVVNLDPAAIGEDAHLYVKLMNADGGADIGFQSPSPAAAAAFRTRLDGGLRLLDGTLPELSGEIRAIVRQIVIAGGDPQKSLQFDGGSHYQLWGALFLNCEFHPDEIAVVEVLAHECAHSLLFGFCTDEPLVTNDDDDLFPSPLRADKRPMDGIFHATFVSARMHWAMSQLAARGGLAPEQRKRVLDMADSDLANFRAGYSVVAEHGELTDIGRGLMQGAKDYIESVA